MTGYGLLAMVTGDRVGEAFPVARYILSLDWLPLYDRPYTPVPVILTVY